MLELQGANVTKTDKILSIKTQQSIAIDFKA